MCWKINKKDLFGKTLEFLSSKVFDAKSKRYMYMPYWFEETPSGYIAHSLGSLPDALTNAICKEIERKEIKRNEKRLNPKTTKECYKH